MLSSHYLAFRQKQFVRQSFQTRFASVYLNDPKHAVYEIDRLKQQGIVKPLTLLAVKNILSQTDRDQLSQYIKAKGVARDDGRIFATEGLLYLDHGQRYFKYTRWKPMPTVLESLVDQVADKFLQDVQKNREQFQPSNAAFKKGVIEFALVRYPLSRKTPLMTNPSRWHHDRCDFVGVYTINMPPLKQGHFELRYGPSWLNQELGQPQNVLYNGQVNEPIQQQTEADMLLIHQDSFDPRSSKLTEHRITPMIADETAGNDRPLYRDILVLAYCDADGDVWE